VKVAVITVSDRASRGIYQDLSGPAIQELLSEHFREDLELESSLVPDEEASLREALERHKDCQVILTTGGTGLGVRDITPEVCRDWCDREVPGIAEALRAHSLAETPMAMLSRGYAGLKGSCLVINLPGSVKAVRSCTAFLLPVLVHAGAMIRGEGH